MLELVHPYSPSQIWPPERDSPQLFGTAFAAGALTDGMCWVIVSSSLISGRSMASACWHMPMVTCHRPRGAKKGPLVLHKNHVHPIKRIWVCAFCATLFSRAISFIYLPYPMLSISLSPLPAPLLSASAVRAPEIDKAGLAESVTSRLKALESFERHVAT